MSPDLPSGQGSLGTAGRSYPIPCGGPWPRWGRPLAETELVRLRRLRDAPLPAPWASRSPRPLAGPPSAVKPRRALALRKSSHSRHCYPRSHPRRRRARGAPTTPRRAPAQSSHGRSPGPGHVQSHPTLEWIVSSPPRPFHPVRLRNGLPATRANLPVSGQGTYTSPPWQTPQNRGPDALEALLRRPTGFRLGGQAIPGGARRAGS